MQEDIFLPAQSATTRAFSPTVRELLAMGFRHRRLAVLSFSGILVGALIAAPMLPKYRANTKILVRHERLDPDRCRNPRPDRSPSPRIRAF